MYVLEKIFVVLNHLMTSKPNDITKQGNPYQFKRNYDFYKQTKICQNMKIRRFTQTKSHVLYEFDYHDVIIKKLIFRLKET